MGYLDRDLPATLRAAFGALDAPPPPLELDAVCRVIEGDLGAGAGALLRTLRSTPIAAGAVAQVHRSTLPDGTPVAVKVRRPDFDDCLARDLDPERLAGRLAAWRGGGRLEPLAAQLAGCIEQQGDFALVAQRQERFWWLYASHPTIVVPPLERPHCGARVLTSAFLAGADLDKYLASQPSQEARDRAGAALFDFYVGTLLEHGLYSCDPDPAHHVFLRDGRIAFVAFGCVRELGHGLVGRLTALTHALGAGDAALLHRALAALGAADADDDPDAHQEARALLGAAYGPLLRDEVAAFAPPPLGLGDALERWRQTSVPAVSAELFFLLRMMLGLGALMARLGARANWHRRLQALLPARFQPSFDVVLLHPGDSTITMVRELRDATGLPLREIEYLVTKSPQTIKQAIPRAEAEALRVRLERAGAQVELKLVSL